MGVTPIESATATLQNLRAHLEALAEMGVPFHIPPELAESCRKIARLAEIPVDQANIDKVQGEVPAPSLADEVPAPEAPAPTANETDRLRPAGSAGLRWTVPPGGRGGRPSLIRDAVLAAVQPDEEVSAGVIFGRLKAEGVVTNRDTVSNELSRWTHEGILERPVRGTYRLRTMTISDPTRDHEPLAAEERPNDQEGVGGDAATRTEGAAM